MALLLSTIVADEVSSTGDEATGLTYEGETSARICNPAAENGEIEPSAEPLSWLNSARVTADPGEDAVHCLVSIGDPRGAFCFTVRRLTDGKIVIHMPHPGEGMPHYPTADLHPGTLLVTHEAGNADKPLICSTDPAPGDDDDDDDDDE
jgi:hypothetical protein